MTRGALSVCFCWDGPWAEVFPWIIHTTGMDYPAARRIRKKFGQLAIARDHMTICVDDWKGPHSSPPWQFFPVRYFSNLPFGLQCSQRLFVSVIFHAHPALLYRQAWMVPAQEYLWRQPMLSDIQPVLKAIQAGVRREVAMKRTAEVLVWLVLFTAGDQA